MFSLENIPEEEKSTIELLISYGYEIDIRLTPEYKPQRVGERSKSLETEFIDKDISISKTYRIITENG